MAKPKTPILDESLIKALEAIDNQIRRTVDSRTPSDRAVAGVQKWKPYEDRIERLTTLLLDNFGTNVGLDSILVLSQVMIKSLTIVTEDLGEDGLGKLKSTYVRDTINNLEIELERLKRIFKEDEAILM